MAKRKELRTELFESINSRVIQKQVAEAKEKRKTELIDKGIWFMLLMYLVFMGVIAWKIIQIYKMLAIHL